MQIVRSQLRTAFLVGAATALTAVVLGVTPIGLALEENIGLSWLFDMRGPVAPPPQAVVVGINGDTGQALGLPRLPRDWPRSVHSRVIDNLVARGARVIVFDFDFSRQGSVEDNFALAEAITESDRVILQEALEARKIPTRTADGGERIIWLEERRPPTAPLAMAARAIAPFPLPKLGQAVFQFWTFKSSLGDAPTTVAVALQMFGQEWHNDWVDLLAEAGAPNTDQLRIIEHGPAPESQPWLQANPTKTPRQVREMMIKTRNLFVNDPSLADRIAAILAQRQAGDRAGPEQQYFAHLLALYSGTDERYLNFYGPPGTIPTIPYQVLVNGGSTTELGDPVDVEGKVVFVGYSDLHDPGQPDRFYSVFTMDDGVDLSGVEIMASAFGNLANNQVTRPSDLAATIIGLAVFGFVAGVVATMLPALAAVPVVIVLGLAYVAAANWAFATQQLWLPLAIPVLAEVPVALLGGVLAQYLLKRRRERQVTAAISQYLPESTFRDLIKKDFDPTKLDRLVYGTILATDMAGFTTISETRSPEELAGFMNAYFDALGQILKKHGMDFIEFHADTIMCAWTGAVGEAIPQPLWAAVELVDEIVAFGRREGLPLKARVGIKEGEFYLGHTGGSSRVAFSILGDTANTAARLETLNKHLGTRILASQTAAAVADGLVLRPLGRFQVVGRGEPIAVIEVVGKTETCTADTEDLCERFAAATRLFDKADWQAAVDAFRSILKRWPDDGPSHFYERLCEEYLRIPPDTASGVIRMAEKIALDPTGAVS